MNFVLILLITLLFSILGIFLYKNYALRYGPFSIPNYRSLHKIKTPIGGGLIIGLSSFLGIFLIYNLGYLSGKQFLLYGILSLINCFIGVMDERINIHPKYQFGCQLIAAFFTLNYLGFVNILNSNLYLSYLVPIVYILIFFSIVWLYNAFNFVDGTDGMAASCSIMIISPMIFISRLQGYYDISLILSIIAISSFGFLLFNKPKASIFMGDSGTKFLSFILVATVLDSSIREPKLIFIWIILSGFYIVDTTLTTLIRAITIPKFWRGHRSHAYQNLARVWDSHKKVLILSILVNIFWCIPIAIISYFNLGVAHYLTILALTPLVIYSYKYGPKFKYSELR